MFYCCGYSFACNVPLVCISDYLRIGGFVLLYCLFVGLIGLDSLVCALVLMWLVVLVVMLWARIYVEVCVFCCFVVWFVVCLFGVFFVYLFVVLFGVDVLLARCLVC